MIQFSTINDKYLITSHGNGWAYEITHQDSGDSLWFQDSDAEQVQQESKDFELESVIDSYFEALCE